MKGFISPGGKKTVVGMRKTKLALISVSDKTGVDKFARGLSKLGIKIISTGGTAKFLRGKGIPTKEVSEVTKFPEMLEGRVKTLHPLIHAAILARRDKPSHMKTLTKHGITPIDLVVVNLYPFAETVARADVTLEEALENIDIGGPTLLRAAAKNYRAVGVVVNPERYGEVLSELKSTGTLSERTRRGLAIEAFAHTAAYEAAICSYLENTRRRAAGETSFPAVLQLTYQRARKVRYGENPHQRAVLYREARARGIASAKQLQGKELSFNNLVDVDAGWSLSKEFKEPTAVIVKHTNPCGVACGENLREAYERAHACDPTSAYGGAIAVNRQLDGETTKKIISTFIEAVIAPSYKASALKALKKKKDLRVLELPLGGEGVGGQLQFRQISGGMLAQEEDALLLRPEGMKVVTGKKPSEEALEDLVFAWKVVKHVKSNAIVIARDKQAVGIGAGQMSRVDSVEIAIRKAGDRARGAVLASDAFFPFADSIHKAADAGITAIIQPGGSIRDAEVINAANQRGIAMIFTEIRHFRH